MNEQQRRAKDKGDTYARYTPADTNTDAYTSAEIERLSCRIRAASDGQMSAMQAHIKACRLLHDTTPVYDDELD